MKKYNWNNKKLGAPRLYWRKQKGKLDPSVTVKCEDCDNTVTIYYPRKGHNIVGFKNSLEINGVMAETDFWIDLLKKLGE